MKNLVCIALASVSLMVMLTSCIVSSRHGGVGLLLPPPLPLIIDLGPDRHYHNDGYDYYYQGDRWQYSRGRDSRRSDLPQSHWPREIRRHGDWR